MDRFSLVAAEHSSQPILIIDKEGSIGSALFTKLKEYVQVVLVSSAEPEDKQNLLYLPFKKSIPQIPDEQYSHIFLVPETEKQLEDVFSELSTKIQQNKGKLILVLSKEKASQKALTFLKESGASIYTLVVGDLFGGVIIGKLKSRVETLFSTAKRTKKLNLEEMGLRALFPIEFTDAITEIIRVGFGRPAGRLFFLYPQHPMTELGVAHAIQKVDPLLKIDFRKGEIHEDETPISKEGEYLLINEYPLAEKIQKSYETFLTPTDIDEEHSFWEETPGKYVHTKGIPARRIFLGGIFFLVILLILPVISMFLGMGVGVVGLYAAKNALLKGDLVQAKAGTTLAEKSFIFAELAGNAANQEIGIVAPNVLDGSLSILAAGKTLAINADTLLRLTTQTINGLKNKSFSTDDLQESVNEVKTSILSIQKELENSFIPLYIQKIAFEKLTQFSPVLNTLDLFPVIVGANGTRTYLVLFQNNMELRPGGGFIGSYGLLTLNKGKVEDFSIHDVYDADGLLKGHVEPPFPIRRYMPNVHLYLRDSNYNIDFAKNAFIAALLFHQETGKSVDGVIAVDLSFVKNILESVGSVYVPIYKETVTKDNFFLLAETHAEKNFFPGSSQKKDFLRSFFDSLQTKFIESKQMPYETLARSILSSVAQKHVQIAFNDTGAEDLAVANSFASTLWDSRKQEANGVNDLFSINEANIGVNKVNYFISRTVSQDITVHDNGKLTGSVAITYTNSDQAKVWPGGPYKNYLRFFLPKGAILDKVVIDSVEQNMVPAVTSPADYEVKNFVAPKGLEVEKTEEGNTTYYGLLLQVDPGVTKKLTIFYTLSQAVDLSQPVFSYSQWIIKQPGTDEYPFSFTFTYPSGYKVLNAKNLQYKNSTLHFSGNQTQDLFFSLKFGKN